MDTPLGRERPHELALTQARVSAMSGSGKISEGIVGKEGMLDAITLQRLLGSSGDAHKEFITTDSIFYKIFISWGNVILTKSERAGTND